MSPKSVENEKRASVRNAQATLAEEQHADNNLEDEKEIEAEDACVALHDQISDDERIKQLIQDNVHLIKTRKHRSKRIQDRYNYELRECGSDNILEFIKEIASEQEHPFLLNLSFGFILENIMTEQLVFYYASINNRVLERPVLIRNMGDVKNFMTHFNTLDLLEYCRKQRPNTKFVVRLLTNALFYVNRFPSFNVGCGHNLPGYITSRTCVLSFHVDRHGTAYDDNLCFFRCYAYHVTGNEFCSPYIIRYYLDAYCRMKKINADQFEGVPFTDLKLIEQLFHVSIDVYYQLEQYWGRMVVETKRIRASEEDFSDRMSLCAYQCHFSYIKDLNTFAQTWKCSHCNKMFRKVSNLKRHEKVCLQEQRRRFPGGGCGVRRTLFEELYEEGIDVPWEDRFYPYVLALDCEAMSAPVSPNVQRQGKKHQLLGEQQLASISISTNVPQFETSQCFISNGDPDKLMAETMEYMLKVANVASGLLKEKYRYVTDALLDRATEELGYEKEEEEEEEDVESSHEGRYARLHRVFSEWLNGLTCLTFNGRHYDIPLLRRHLFPYCIKKGIKVDRIIKKGNAYLAIEIGPLVFRDICNYLNAGCSYAGWLAASGITETKGYFPFDAFQTIDFLDTDHLPSHESFFSTLKQKNITTQQYEHVRKVWNENGFTSVKDLLRWYNTRDTSYFIEAAEKMMRVWKELKLDCFRGGDISMPGLALRHLLSTMQPHTILPLFTPQTAYLYDLIRENLVGGLAITIHRYHEAGVTTLPNGKLCRRILSFDANALYGWALGEPQPTSLFRVWSSKADVASTLPWNVHDWDQGSSGFDGKRQRWLDAVDCNMATEFSRRDAFPFARSEVEWLEWMSYVRQMRVDHKYNGRAKTIFLPNGKHYRVDGYNAETTTVFSFQGCFWHGHGCHLDREKNETRQRQRRQKTQECNEALIHAGYLVEAIWECAWREQKRTRADVRCFIDEHLSLGIAKTRCRASELMEMIESGTAFGMILCDVEVPPWAKSLLEYFDEYPPICKHVTLTKEDLSPHMKEYAEANGYMKAPVKCLVNSFWARKMLFTTPLIRWFTSHGLVVTRVYQFIEAKPKQCFSELRDVVANKRREADRDPVLKPVGETWKTILNSCYGKTMARKECYKDTELATDDNVQTLMNDSRFCKMEEVGDVAYEVCRDKATAWIDVPAYIALSILNMGKMRMNEFVYDCLKKYLREGSYCLCASDTDSMWSAYESENVFDLVKSEMRDQFEKYGKEAFFAIDAHTSRTPGLFKEEMSASGFISLGSKTYLAWNHDETKISSKGLSKTTNQFKKEDFMKVLTTKKKGIGVNYGFQIIGDRVMSYRQEREGLPYLYFKRAVEPDGITTKALLV